MSTQQIPVNTIRELKESSEPVPFYEALTKALKKRKTNIDLVCPQADPVARRILEEYGAVFVADKKVKPPPVCVFTNEEQVTKWQDEAGFKAEFIAYDEVELQPEALKHLLKAREDARKEGLDITPRDGAEAARRNYEDSVRLWNSRFEPALEYWKGQGRLTAEQVNSFAWSATLATGRGSSRAGKKRNLLQQRSVEIDSLFNCGSRRFATHRDARLRRE